MAETIEHGMDALIEGSGQQKRVDDDAFLESVKRDNPHLYKRWMAGPQLISFCRAAEDTITIYGALRTYLKVLTQQQEEDLETIGRVTRLMIAIKPQAVEASQEIANRNTSS